MTPINSALFNPGWREKFGVDYERSAASRHGRAADQGALRRTACLARADSGAHLRQQAGGRRRRDRRAAGDDRERRRTGHPRNAGTYSRILAHYVREQGTITLMDALRKMSLMPAQRLERRRRRRAKRPPAGGRRRRHHRLRSSHGQRPIDVPDAAGAERGRALFGGGGTVVIDEGKIVPDVFPGRALLGPGKRHGIARLATACAKVHRSTHAHVLECLRRAGGPDLVFDLSTPGNTRECPILARSLRQGPGRDSTVPSRMGRPKPVPHSSAFFEQVAPNFAGSR